MHTNTDKILVSTLAATAASSLYDIKTETLHTSLPAQSNTNFSGKHSATPQLIHTYTY